MQKNNEKLSTLVQKLASPKIILLSLFGFIAIMLLVNIFFRQSFSYLTQTFNYSPQYAYDLLTDIGEIGRRQHLLVLLPDVAMVLLYTSFLLGSNYAIFTRLTTNCTIISILTLFPIILSIVQFSEILILAVIILQFPTVMLNVAQVANLITMSKTILTVLCFLTPLLGLCVLFIKKGLRNGGKKYE